MTEIQYFYELKFDIDRLTLLLFSMSEIKIIKPDYGSALYESVESIYCSRKVYYDLPVKGFVSFS